MADLREKSSGRGTTNEDERERDREEERREDEPRDERNPAPERGVDPATIDAESATIDRNGTVARGTGGDGEIVPEADPDGGRPEAEESLDVFAVARGGPADNTGMQRDVEQEHLLKPQDMVMRVGEGTVPGMQGEGLEPSQGAVNIGYDPGSVTGGPATGAWHREDEESPFGQSGSSSELESTWAGTLAENPNVVGASREEEALAAADPDMTGLVDMDAIATGQVGGTIDGRTPDGAGVGDSGQGFQATSGWSGANTLEGANAANALTNPHNAADAVMKGIQSHGHGNFFVHDASTGEQIYGPGTHNSDVAPAQLPGSGKPGEYKVTPVPDTSGDDAAAPTDGTTETAPPTATEQVSEALETSGQTGTLNTEAAAQMEQIDWGDTAKDYDPETAPGNAPPPGLDLSKDWAIKVWAKENETINPNPMGEQFAGAAEVMDISDFTKQYEHATSDPTVDAEALVAAHNDKIGWEFDEAPDGGA